MATNCRLAIDIGGTFTDGVLDADGRHYSLKLPTNPDEPEQGFMDIATELVRAAGVGTEQVAHIIHGTTLATNAIIERKGSTTALLTTRGFRDSLEIGYESRHDQYDLGLTKIAPLVPRVLRRAVPERCLWDGSLEQSLDEAALLEQLEFLDGFGVESIAIGFLHAYANPDNEERAAEIVRSCMPDIALSLSSRICPEIREYERFSTTVADAYVKPIMARYLGRLEQLLGEAGFGCPLLLVTSAGGLTGLDDARERPVQLVESGPSGGAMLSEVIARCSNEKKVLSYDMGGTTAKICLIENYRAATSREFEAARGERFARGSGLPLRIPVKEMIEIGAGGGSLATRDELGRLVVGPQSAGSNPGPACYARGGDAATVTDADLLLGRLDPDNFADGRMQLDQALASESIDRSLPISEDNLPWQRARGIMEMVDENMAGAARIHAIEHASNLREHTMVAFGGAGPLHAASLARKLDIKRVIVPTMPGVGSAVGFLHMPVSAERVRSQYMTLDSLQPETVLELFQELESAAAATVCLVDPRGAIHCQRHALLRYAGQGHEVKVSVPSDLEPGRLKAWLTEGYACEYRKLYGRTLPDNPVELMTFSVRVWTEGYANRAPLEQLCGDDSGLTPAASQREIFDDARGRWRSADVYERHSLAAGFFCTGPALVTEPQTTTVIPSDYTLIVDDQGQLVLDARVSEGEPERDADTDLDLQVLWNRFQSLVDELAAVLMRTAFSPIVRESGDLSVGMFNTSGEMLTQAITGTPGHVNTMASACSSFFDEFPPADMHPGDIYLTNDPWLGAGHLNDFVLLKPCFHSNELVGMVSCTSHLVDIGGRCLGPDGNDVYDEGLYIPPMRLVDQGRMDQTLVSLLKSNSRSPEQAEGDLYALVACCERGQERVHEILAGYDPAIMDVLSRRILGSTEAAVRDRIAAIPDGRWDYAMTVDGFEEPIELGATLEIRGEALKLDFHSSCEPSRHGINVPLNYTRAYSVFGLKCAIAPDVPNNQGALNPLQVNAREKSILDARKPAPVCSRHILGQLLPDVALGCLSAVMPDVVPAEGASTLWDLPMSGTYLEDGRTFAQELVFNGGTGARPDADGLSATAYPSGVLGSLVEITESTTPIKIRRREFRNGSGGRGRYRGGHGQTIEIEALAGTRLRVYGTVDRVKFPARGRCGGQPGAPGRFELSNGRKFVGKGFCDLEAGESITVHTPGGGGWGEESLRAENRVLEERENGLDCDQGETGYE